MKTDAATKALRVLRDEIGKTTDPQRLHSFIVELNELLSTIENQISRLKRPRR